MQKIIEKIKASIQEVSGIDAEEIEEDSNLFSLGLDSLMLVQVKKRIDQEFQIELPMGRVMSDLDTIEKIAHFIKGDDVKQEILAFIDKKERGAQENQITAEEVVEDIKPEEQTPTVVQAVSYEEKQAEEPGISELPMQDYQEPVQSDSFQDVLKMQMQVMAESLQNLAAKQLEVIGKKETINRIPQKTAPKQPVIKLTEEKKEFPQINFRAVKLDRDIFTEEQKVFIRRFIERYNLKTAKSKRYARINRKKFCDWIASLNFRTDFKELIYPIVSQRSQGSKFWDLDGNEYLDMAIGYGVHYFGHRPQFILDALEQQIAEGYETGPQTDLGGETAGLICKITGAERVAFSNTGSEAVMAAIRIARTVNKKSKIVMFHGSYHGNFDGVLAESMDGETFPTSPGTMPGMVEDMMVLDYDSEETLQIIKEHGNEIAGVLVEPVQSRNPGLQPKEFLHKLRELTEQIHAALIFDEMITGFRICPGGCQEYFGVHADMATYGKIIGGGLPIGVVAGKAEYLDAVDGGYWNYGDDSYPEKEMTFFAGTFCKHPLSLAASRAVLRYLDQDKGQVQKKVNKLTADFVQKVNDYFQEQLVPLRVKCFGSEFRFEAYGKYDLSKLPAEIELFFYLLMEKGIYIWEKRTCFFSAAHTSEDAAFFYDAIRACVREMRENGFSFTSDNTGSSKKKTKLKAEPVKDNFKISKTIKAQERYFMVSQMGKAELGTHLPSAFLLTGDFKAEKVSDIFQQIISEQESLRACFGFEQGELILKVYNSCKLNIETEEGQESEMQQYILDFLKPFDLFQAPLMHAKVIKFSDTKYLLLWDIHHSIADGYACTLITKRFMDLYEGKAEEMKGKTREEFIQYQKEVLESPAYEEAMNYWRRELGNQDYRISFPLDYQRTENNNTEGNQVKQVIDQKMLLGLKEYAKKKQCSLYHLLYGAFALLLYKMTGQKMFVIGTPVSVRDVGMWETVDYCTNTVPVKSRMEASWTLEDYLKETKFRCGQSIAYSKLQFAELAALTAAYQKANHNPIFDIMFVFENGEERVNHIAELGCERVEIPVYHSFYDLNFEIIEEYKELSICVTYKKSLYKESSIDKIIGCYIQLLNEMKEHSEWELSSYLAEYEEDWKKERKRQELFRQLEENAAKQKQEEIPKQNSRAATDLEEELAGYWRESLHLDYINIHENFFDLGGRSIDAIDLMDKLRKVYEVNIMDLFKYPTVEQLARKISGERTKTVSQETRPLETSSEKTYSGQMPIAIIGMAGRFPKSRNVEEFWNNLVEGNECIQFFEKEELLEEGISEADLEEPGYVSAKGVLENAERFDASFFEYSPKEAKKMDPQIRVFHECAWNALEDAGYTPGSLLAGGDNPQKVGVFAGSATNYTWMTHIYEPTSDGQERMERISLNDKDYMATRISYKMNLIGPSYGVQTACSSSLTSIHLACRALELGECEMALAGGVSIMLPKESGYCYQEGMILSKDGHCRVFDKDASGTVFSDGAGALILKPLEQAKADKDHIYAVIIGSAVNNDGNRKAGYTAPSIDGQAQVIEQALKNAQIDSSSVTCLEAHGTGTLLGDPIEVEGLKEAYPDTEKSSCALGSLKSNFGHLDAAAGVAGVIKTALALHFKKIPASINCQNPNPDMHLDESSFYIPQETRNWTPKEAADHTELPRRAGVTSLGFGGTNAHIILEEFQNEPEVEKTEYQEKTVSQLFPISARTKQALERTVEQYAAFFQEHEEINLSEAAYTLQTGRKPFAYRKVIVASNREELLAGLHKGTANHAKKQETAEKEKMRLVFLFTGQGSQYVNMAKGLYEKEAIFRQYMNQCFSIVKDQLGCPTDYKAILFPQDGQEETSRQLINETGNAQVILFMLEYSIASFLIKTGAFPDALIGHSLGEYVAACVAGVYSLEDGLRLIIQRARIMQSVEHGGMDAIGVSVEEAVSLIKRSGCNISVATQNGAKNCVVSGAYEELKEFEEFLEKNDTDYQRLHTSHAFHSDMMDSVLDAFEGVVRTIPMSRPRIPYISNLTGDWVTEQVLKPEYWRKHLRNTVRFYDGIKTLLEQKSIFVEVGPGNVLSSFVKQCSSLGNVHTVYNMVRHPKEKADDAVHFMKGIGQLWCSGVNVDFRIFYEGNDSPFKTSLPGYPFFGQEFKVSQMMGTGNADQLPMSDWFYKPCWKLRSPKAGTFPENASALIIGKEDHITECFYKKLKDNGISCTVIIMTDLWEAQLQEYIARYSEENRKLYLIYLLPYTEPSQETCFWQLLRQVQLAGNCANAHCYILTKDDASKTGLANSLVEGVCSVANKEYESLSCTQIELEGDLTAEQAADLAVLECAGGMKCSRVKYKNGVRLEQEEEPLDLPEEADSRLYMQGNYLITGGMGDIGRYLTDYLIKNYQANLLLLAKNELPEEESWDYLLEKQPNNPNALKIQSVRKWRDEGARVTIKVCDICDEAAVENCVSEFEHTYGSIQGIFHTAGIKGEGLIRFKTREQAMAVLEPKVQGIQVLDNVFAQRELDFMMLFSSLAATTKNAGQSDYVAANRYLDAYAAWSATRYPDRKTISIQWDSFKNIGMAHRATVEKPNLKTFFANTILPSQAMKVMERALAGKEHQVIVSVQNLIKRKQAGEPNQQEALVKRALMEDSKYDRPELSVEYVEPETKLEKHLANVWAAAFSIKTIGIKDDFFELGGDSLYAVGIVNELKKSYQIDMTDIYNAPTIEQLANTLKSRSFHLEQQLAQVKMALERRKDTAAREQELKEERARYYTLCKSSQNTVLGRTKKWKQILLLGGTGYLGIYLLKEIVTQTEAQVVLIVRPGKQCDGQARVQEKFCAYFGEELYQLYQDRWLVLDGEIAKQNFGLPYSVYWELAKSTECIVNASGKADHYGEYEAFYEANVESVQQVAAFAKTGCKKEIHHMSTKGIGTGKIEDRNAILYTEFDTDFGQTFENYYVSTKHDAEKNLLDLRKEGYNVNLYRLGDIVYDSASGHFQENIDKNAVYLLMQAILKLDCLPEMDLAFMDFSYVDFVSKAVVALIKQEELVQETYHLLNPYLLSLKDLEPVIKRAGFSIPYVEDDVFIQYLYDNYDNKKKKEAIQNFLTYSHFLELPAYTEFVMASDKTCSQLEQLNLVWEKPDTESLHKMIEYGQKIHFFPQSKALENELL